MAKILIVDDHDVVRQGLKALLDRPGWEIVGEAADGISAVEMAEATKPDVIILDYSLPNMNGADVARHIRTILPTAEVIIFTLHDAEEVVRDALSAGVRGFLMKSDGSRQLIAAVKSLINHQPYFTAKVDKVSSSLFPPRPRGARGVSRSFHLGSVRSSP